MLKSKDKKPDIKKIVSRMGIVFVLIALTMSQSSLSQSFLTISSLLLITKQVSLYSILRVGMAIVLVIGGINLPIGSIVALFAVFAARYCSGDHLNISLYIPIVIAVLIDTACGVTNGLGIVYTKIPPFIMTMCTMLAARGAAYVCINAKAIFSPNERLVSTPNDFSGRVYNADGIVDNYGIPYMVFYFAGAVTIGVLILHLTTYGRRIHVLGGNKSVARCSGIDTWFIECPIYATSRSCAGICGFLMASRISSDNVNSVSGYEMTVISAAAVGGASLLGGIGTMYGAMVGALITGVISNRMDTLGINTHF